jgi:hypothetical protein
LQDVHAVIGKQYGYGRVALYYPQQEIDVVALVGGCHDLFCGVGPYFHAFALLCREVVDKAVGEIEKYGG